MQVLGQEETQFKYYSFTPLIKWPDNFSHLDIWVNYTYKEDGGLFMSVKWKHTTSGN